MPEVPAFLANAVVPTSAVPPRWSASRTWHPASAASNSRVTRSAACASAPARRSSNVTCLGAFAAMMRELPPGAATGAIEVDPRCEAWPVLAGAPLAAVPRRPERGAALVRWLGLHLREVATTCYLSATAPRSRRCAAGSSTATSAARPFARRSTGPTASPACESRYQGARRRPRTAVRAHLQNAAPPHAPACSAPK
jgi:hypothetical protein